MNSLLKHKIYFIILILIGAGINAQGQPQQLLPPNGGNGIPGVAPRSFIIQWDSLPGVVGYQYISSDNHLCFSGCPGDTREGITLGLGVQLNNLQLNKWYYWIVRGLYANGDTTESSPIWSFRTIDSGGTNLDAPLVTVYPNPSTESYTNIVVEWVIDPKIQKIFYDLLDFKGNAIRYNEEYKLKKEVFIRQEKVPVSLEGLSSGIYFLIIRVDDKIPITEKIIIQ